MADITTASDAPPASVLVRVGQSIGVLGAILVIAFWIDLLRSVRSAGPRFPILGFVSIIVAAFGFAFALRARAAALLLCAFLLSPLALYFYWSDNTYSWIAVGTLGLAVSGIVLALGRRIRWRLTRGE